MDILLFDLFCSGNVGSYFFFPLGDVLFNITEGGVEFLHHFFLLLRYI